MPSAAPVSDWGEAILTSISAALGMATPETPSLAGTATPPGDQAVSLEAARQLTALLSESDPAASDFVESNRRQLEALFDAAGWAEFESLVEGYAFAEAQARLEHALRASSWSR